MIRDHVQRKIETALKALKVPITAFSVEHTSNAQFGDYSCNIAMQLTKQLKKNPILIAEEIVKKIDTDEIIDKVEVAKPGFINFWINKKTLLHNLKSITNHANNYGRNDKLKNEKIIVEFTDPNPFKEFHIGHLYSNIVGESLARLYDACGAEVKRVTYQGDVGMHVAKSLWGMQELMSRENISVHDLEKLPIKERVKFLGKSYSMGATAYEENETAKKNIVEINKQVYEKDARILSLYALGRKWSLEYFDSIYERLGSQFEKNFFESEVGPRGREIVNANLIKGIFKKSNGAVVFPGEDFGLHTRVFINSLGLPTYEAKELGLAPTKYEWYPYTMSVIVTGNEINEYFKVLLAALDKIYPELRRKTTHISHGMVRLPDGKMSSRTGKVLLGEWLLDEAAKKAMEVMGKNTHIKVDSTLQLNNEPGWLVDTAELIGKAAIKYALLKNSIGKDVEFDFDESVSFEGNSGPYIQYTYVRCRSVLEKSPVSLQSAESINDIAANKEELQLLRSLIKFTDIVRDSALHRTPNSIANYLYNIAQEYNLFYQKHTILKADEETVKFRILLTHSVSQIISNGLGLLGIQTVEKM